MTSTEFMYWSGVLSCFFVVLAAIIYTDTSIRKNGGILLIFFIIVFSFLSWLGVACVILYPIFTNHYKKDEPLTAQQAYEQSKQSLEKETQEKYQSILQLINSASKQHQTQIVIEEKVDGKILSKLNKLGYNVKVSKFKCFEGVDYDTTITWKPNE